ncbi:MAG: hypothetical protein WC023_11965 [Rhodocyclaceae bacterium]
MLRYAILLSSLFLSACSMYQGRVVANVPFKVDGGRTIMLPMTNVGALPGENDLYKVEVAGVNAQLAPGQPDQSTLTWVFSALIKNSVPIESVTVERVAENGDLAPLVDDRAVSLKAQSWLGHAAPQPVTQDSVPWLYRSGNSSFLFKFTVRVAGEPPSVIYQPSLISHQVKTIYLDAIGNKKSR